MILEKDGQKLRKLNLNNMAKTLELAIFISGGGSTAAAVIESCRNGELKGKVDPVVVVASRDDAGEHVKRLGAMPIVVPRRQLGERLLLTLNKFQPDLIAQLGWLPQTPDSVLALYPALNQHPGKLDPGRPDFGGQGMYGRAVMCATLAYHQAVNSEEWDTEATTHIVISDYDQGSLLRTQRMSLGKFTINSNLLEATIEEQRKLLPVEHQNVILTLIQIYEQNGRLAGFRRDQPLIPEQNIPVLQESKRLARELFPRG